MKYSDVMEERLKTNGKYYARAYYGPQAVAPSVGTGFPNVVEGDLYFDTVLKEMRVYDGQVWKAAGSTVNGTSVRESFTATDGQTTFTVTGGYDAGYIDVYRNGYKLANGTDVDVSSGTEVVLTDGAADGDIVDIVAYGTFLLADFYSKAEGDDRYSVRTQTKDTVTRYPDNSNGKQYKLYVDDGQIVMEEV